MTNWEKYFRPDNKRWGKYTEEELEEQKRKSVEEVYITFKKPKDEMSPKEYGKRHSGGNVKIDN